jgi:hypothetical protein
MPKNGNKRTERGLFSRYPSLSLTEALRAVREDGEQSNWRPNWFGIAVVVGMGLVVLLGLWEFHRH